MVTVRVPHTEMGQGALTSVAMLIAEELNVDWSKIQTVFADANRHVTQGREYKVMSTHGSQLVRLQHPHIMQAGASARERLKEAAAQAWGVDRSAVEAKLGVLKVRQALGHVRRIRDSRREDHARRGARDQDAGSMVAARHVEAATRYPVESGRQRRLRDRHAPAGHGVRGSPLLSRAVGRAEDASTSTR